MKDLKTYIGLFSGLISLAVAIFLGVSWLNSPTIKIDTLNTRINTYILNHEKEHKSRAKYVDMMFSKQEKQFVKLERNFDTFKITQEKRYEKIITLIMQL